MRFCTVGPPQNTGVLRIDARLQAAGRGRLGVLQPPSHPPPINQAGVLKWPAVSTHNPILLIRQRLSRVVSVAELTIRLTNDTPIAGRLVDGRRSYVAPAFWKTSAVVHSCKIPAAQSDIDVNELERSQDQEARKGTKNQFNQILIVLFHSEHVTYDIVQCFSKTMHAKKDIKTILFYEGHVFSCRFSCWLE